MVNTAVRSIIALTFFCMTLTASAVGQQVESCSVRDLNGSYGFSIKGQNLGLNVGYILTGIFRADGSGSFSGTGQQNVGGQPSAAQFSGTYLVNPDCTGTAKFFFPDGTEADLYFIIVENGSEVTILDVGTGVLESGSAKKIKTGKPLAA